MEKPVGAVSSAVESSLLQRVHAILRELDADIQAGFASNKGMLRWTLHKKVESNPSTGAVLLSVLVKELEKADRIDCKIRIVPLLHTLLYTLLQCVFIADDLYERIYVCLKRLLTLPKPYCSVGLHYARLIQMELRIPGALYQRRIIAEHSLKNEHYALHERVLVFLDASVLPDPLQDAVRADVECVSACWDSRRLQRSVLLHTLQAALGKHCHGHQLAQALQGSGEEMEKHFCEVVAAVEEGLEDGGSDKQQYSQKLQQIYHHILPPAAVKSRSSSTCLVGTSLPSPEISFHIWSKEDEIWNKVVNFALMLSPADRSSAFLCEDDEDDAKRDSVLSTMSVDSGIEGDLPLNEFSFLMVEPPAGAEASDQRKSFYFSRKPCVRSPKASNRTSLMMEAMRGGGGAGGGNSLLKEEKNLTARVVVMGDDSSLGRLGRAYHNIRKREARHLFLTKRLNLEFYYVPVNSQAVTASPDKEDVPAEDVDMLTLAEFLGRLDPWYDCNISSLGTKIPKLAEMHSSVGGSSKSSSFLLDVISYYTRTAQLPVHLPIYSVKMTFSGLNSKPVEDVFVCQLDMDFPEFRPQRVTFKNTVKGSVRHRKLTHEDGGIIVSVNYRKASISNREVDRSMSLSTCGVLICAVPSYGTRSPDSLSVDFQNPFPTRSSVSTLRVTSVCIRALEEKTFTVCLDKDSNRFFKNVQSVEVSTCPDPAYCLQKSSKSSSRVPDENGSVLGRFLNKNLCLPINTFSGAV